MRVGESPLQQKAHVLYREHQGWLFGWLRGKLGNSGDAADIAHDAFVRLRVGLRADAIPTLREPRAYLTTVARRLVINHCERQSLERAYHASLALPPKARTAFLSSQLEGLAYEEIAVQLQVGVRTVARYMAQGFAQCLRPMLAQST
jgi:DNA-directed RNA polymerase specialized sigma24 family protein